MPFTLRLYQRFPVRRAIMYNTGSLFTLPLTYVLSFGILLTLLVSSGPAYAEWMSLGESDAGTTVYADSATMRREGDLVKMSVLFDFKTIQAKADVSYLSAKAQMEYDCAEQHFGGGLRSCIFRTIWETVSCLIAAQAKTDGYEFQQAVLTTLCGNLHAARSDRAVACNLRCRQGYTLSNQRSKRESMSIEEVTAIVEMLERLGRIIEMGQRVANGLTAHA